MAFEKGHEEDFIATPVSDVIKDKIAWFYVTAMSTEFYYQYIAVDKKLWKHGGIFAQR